MTLRTLGAIPGGQLHPGLKLCLKPLEDYLNELNGEAAAIDANLDLNIDPGFLETAAASFNALLDVEVGAAVELDAIEAKLDAIAALKDDLKFLANVSARLSGTLGTLEAALGIGAIAAWSYDGAAGKFAPLLSEALRDGLGAAFPGDEIRAAIFATSSPANWATFSGAIYTGWGGGEVATEDEKGLQSGTLKDLGQIPGGTLCAQAALAGPQISGEITAVAQTMVDITVNLGLLLTANMGIGVSAGAAAALAASASLLFPVPSVSLSLTIDPGLAPIVADMKASLNGSGVHLWSYEGPASGLGAEFRDATRQGIAGGRPTDRSMGLVIATDNVAAWDDLNQVLKVK